MPLPEPLAELKPCWQSTWMSCFVNVSGTACWQCRPVLKAAVRTPGTCCAAYRCGRGDGGRSRCGAHPRDG